MAKAKIDKKVLVVEDDKDFIWILKQGLVNKGFLVIFAEDGEEGLKTAEQEKPDLILLDILMPKMDGIKALEEIRKARPSTMVLMVSGDLTVDRVKEALANGAAGFVVKPLKPASVLDKISSCWKQKNAHA